MEKVKVLLVEVGYGFDNLLKLMLIYNIDENYKKIVVVV